MSVVQNNGHTTRPGGVTGVGFLPGMSGNPGERPKGLSRRVRELVGEDGDAIADYLFSVMSDEKARTADRLEAAKLLADRGFGRTVQTLDLDVTAHPPIDVTQLSTPDLELSGACRSWGTTSLTGRNWSYYGVVWPIARRKAARKVGASALA
jgi:hypothetical protein